MNQTFGFNDYWAWFLLGILFLTWVGLYQERNALSERLDIVIMHAKSENNLAMLEDESSEAETRVEDLGQYQEMN